MSALSCAVMLLLPAPALAATATVAGGPGVRSTPRALAPAAAPAVDGGWESRLRHRLSGMLGDDRSQGGPDRRGRALPLPPLFGHHDASGGVAGTAGQRRPAAGAPEGGAAGERPRHPDSGRSDHAAGRHVHPHPGPLPSLDAAGTTDDGESGGTSPDPVRSGTVPGTGPGTGGEAAEHPEGEQAGGASPSPDGVWSPAPVAPEDAVAGGGDPGRPQAGPPRRIPADDPVGAPAEGAPAAPAATAAPAGPVLPVLPLGAGLTCLGLGLAFLALRLRRG